MYRTIASLFPVCLSLAACVGMNDTVSSDPTVAADLSGTERIAGLLELAETAEREGNSDRLGDALQRLESTGASPADPDTKELLEQWRSMAPSDIPPMRGRALGPGFRAANIGPAETQTFEQTFLAGKRASIVASARGDAVIRLEVGPAGAEPVCSRNAQRNTCSWTPVFTSRYSIRVTNPGRQTSRYYLVIE